MIADIAAPAERVHTRDEISRSAVLSDKLRHSQWGGHSDERESEGVGMSYISWRRY